jgi:transcriptional regulator with XRE-family HTH domain
MPDEPYDLERIKSVLADATKTGAEFSRRSLGKAAGEHRDTVGDILNGRNKNPTTKVLSNLAHALGGDLSLFGLAEDQVADITEAELESALLKALKKMPARATHETKARYLADNLGQLLQLPPRRSSTE